MVFRVTVTMIDPGRIWQSVLSLTGLKTERAILFPVKRSYFLCLPLLTHETDNRMFLNIFEYSTEYLCIWGIFILSLSLSLSLPRASGYKLSVNYQWLNRDFFSGLSVLSFGETSDSVHTPSSLAGRRNTIFSGDIRNMEMPCPYIAGCFTIALPGSRRTSITMKRHDDRITR